MKKLLLRGIRRTLQQYQLVQEAKRTGILKMATNKGHKKGKAKANKPEGSG